MLENIDEVVGEPISPKKQHHAPIGLICAILAVAVIMVILGFMWRVKLKTSSITVELGERASEEAEDYLWGKRFAVGASEVDQSTVNFNKVGNYVMKIYHKPFCELSVNVAVVDTTAPMVHVKESTQMVEMGAFLWAADLIESEFDQSGKIIYEFTDIVPKGAGAGSEESPITFYSERTCATVDDCNEYDAYIKASDPSGNTVDVVATIKTDTHPTILSASDYYVAVGEEVNFLDGVVAWDTVDKDVTTSLEYEVDSRYLVSPGDYDVRYSAVDSNGFMGFTTTQIHVFNPVDLQELVNLHVIDPFANNVKGAINPYDCGTYEDLDMEHVLNYVEPAIVHLRYDFADGGWVRGSGFIISIDDENIVVCTNRHVVDDTPFINVYFYNGDIGTAEVMAVSEGADIALVKVPVSDFNCDFVQTLKTVHVNYDYWCQLPDNPADLEIGLRAIDEDGEVWIESVGVINRKIGMLSCYYEGFDYPVTQVTAELKSGTSGSAIVDEYGNLVSMAAYSWFNGVETEYYGIKLSDIVAFYKETTGKELYYY